jgi:hypothetical protein
MKKAKKLDISNNRCIICGKAKPGLAVKDDFVLNSIRWFKHNITKNEKGYHLVVCKECYLKYQKERNKYVKRQIFYLIIGILFAMMLIFVSRGSLPSIGFGILMVLILYVFSLFSYMPAVEIPKKFIKMIKERDKNGE